MSRSMLDADGFTKVDYTTISDCSDRTDWGVSGLASAVVTDEPSFAKLGSTSGIKVVATAVGSQNVQLYQNNVDLDMPQGELGLWIYIEDISKLDASGSVKVYLSDSPSNWTNYAWLGLVPIHDGWSFFEITGEDWTLDAGGAPLSFANPVRRIRVQFEIEDDSTAVCGLSYVGHSGKCTPKCMITADDSDDSQDLLVQALDARNLRGVFYTIAQAVDGTNGLTKAQLQAYKATGHEIAVHGNNSYRTYADEAEIRADIKLNRDFVKAIDPAGANHLAYPNGFFGTDAGENRQHVEFIPYAQAEGILSARTTISGGIPTYENVYDPMLIKIIGWKTEDRAAGVPVFLAEIDRSINIGESFALMFHKIVAGSGAEVDIEINETNLGLILDHIKMYENQGQLDNLIASELYEQRTVVTRSTITRTYTP